MAYQEKYYFTFIGRDDKNYRVEIWEDTEEVLTAEEIRCSTDPFSVTYPQFNILEPIRGSGCVMNLFAETDRQFLSLYSSDMLKYQIRLKKNDGIYWWGYLDSELYKEPFQYLDGYPVNFTGTDGLALLDRIYYLDDNGDNYTGVVSQWEVIKNILTKLNIIWAIVYIKISTTTSELTIGADETIFHKTLIRNENWYNEDGEPETCRKVLEEILRPYGAFLTISSNMIWITDINTILESNTIDYQSFDSVDFEYNSTTSLFSNLGDLSTIGFMSNSQDLNVINGVNKQVISYSPYKQNTIIDFEAKNDFSGPNTGTTTGSTYYQWTEYLYTGSTIWEKYHNGYFASYIGVDGENEGETEYYLKITPYSFYNGDILDSMLSFTAKQPLPYFLPSENYKLKIAMEVYPRLSNDLGADVTTDIIRFINIYSRLKIGDKKYHYHSGLPMNYGDNSGWVYMDSTDLDCLLVIENKAGKGNEIIYNSLEDKWTDLKYNKVLTMGDADDIVMKLDFNIPLAYPYINGGTLEFSIYNYNVFDMDLNQINADILDLRLKNIKFSIVDSKGNSVGTKDVEYKGMLNPQFKNEASKIRTYCGYNITHHPTERGGLFKFVDGGEGYDYWENISEWSRSGLTNTLENLLLRTAISNNENPTIELTCDVNRIELIVGYLTYNNYLTQKFMITGCKHNFADAISELTLQEITADHLSVYINYQ